MNNTTNPKEDQQKVVVVKQSNFAYAYALIHFLAFLFAIYLVFKCNSGISILQVIVAICCPWIYIIYILVTRKGFCTDYVKGVAPVTVTAL